MPKIEYLVGSETHSSNWGRFYVKGLENFHVREDHELEKNDKHHVYRFFVGNSVPVGTVFTITEKKGSKRGTDLFIFSICVIVPAEENEEEADYGPGYIRGNYRIVARAETRTKAQRLTDWWEKGPQTLPYAEWLGKHIQLRGVKEAPPMPS